MRYISNREYNRKLRQIQKENDTRLKVQKLNEQRNKYKKKKTTASKKALWIMMAIIFEIVIFAQVIMWAYKDFSSLYVLIGIPATMALPLFQYMSKSRAQNTVGGITYQLAMRQQDRIDSEMNICSNEDEISLDQIDLTEEFKEEHLNNA